MTMTANNRAAAMLRMRVVLLVSMVNSFVAGRLSTVVDLEGGPMILACQQTLTYTSSMPRATPRARDADATKAAILAAAREHFAASGYERATIRAIAADAHIDPALVMRY